MADKLEVIITAKDQASGTFGKLTNALGDVAKFATGMIVADVFGKLATGVSDFFTGSIGEAREAIANQKELAQVIESTGGIAGVSADEANSYAEAISKVTNFTDDAILKGENMLLTFTNIGEDVFPRATQAMVDMGQKFGSVDAAAVQLGKALNDPIKGVSALSRIGVTFTEQQKEQIEAMMAVNDIAGAQGIILAEVEKQVGGLAEAVADPAIQMQNAWADAQETMGMAVIPVMNKLSQVALPLLTQAVQFVTPHIEQFGKWALALAEYLIAVVESGDAWNDWLTHLPESIQPIVLGLGQFITITQDLSRYILAVVEDGDYLNDWLTHLPESMQPVVLGFGQFIAIVQDLSRYILAVLEDGDYLNDWLTHLPEPMQPIILGLGQFIAIVQDLTRYILATIDSGDSFNDWITHLPEAIQPAVLFVGNMIVAIQDLGSWIMTTAIPAIQQWGAIFNRDVVPIFQTFIDETLPFFQQAWMELQAVWADSIQPALAELGTSLQELFEALGISTEKTDFWQISLGILKFGLQTITTTVRGLTPLIRGLGEIIQFGTNNVRLFVDMLRGMKNSADALMGVLRSIRDRIRDVINAASSMPDWLIPGSPTPFELGIRGIADAVNSLPEMQLPGMNLATPALATGGGSVSNVAPVVVQVNYSPVLSMADEIELERVLTSVVNKINRKG